MGRTRDVVIVGGGVIGSFLGFLLTKRGKRVTIVEQGDLAGGASGAAAGMLAADCEHFLHPDLRMMARSSRDAFPAILRELRQLSGIDASLNTHGFLTPARNREEAEELHARILDENAGEWWRSEKLRVEEPFLTEELHGAVYRSEETQLIPSKLTEALAYSAQVKGAELMVGTKVTGIEMAGHTVRGIQTSRGLLECEQVVLAGGWQMEELINPLGVTLPLEPVKGEIVEVRSHLPLLQHTLYAESVYIVPKPGNRVWIGATSFAGDRSTGVLAGSILKLVEKAAAYLPGIRGANFERAWSGHRPKTPDALPYLGRVKGIHGLYVSAGHYRNGILLSAGSARLLANEMEGIITPGFDLAPFRPDRFQTQREGITL